MRKIGQAYDYYRCRVLEIVEDRPQPLDWREDVLYREQPPPNVRSAKRFTVQLILVDTSEVYEVKSYSARHTAEKKRALVDEDLRDLTRSEFSKKYGLPWDTPAE